MDGTVWVSKRKTHRKKNGRQVYPMYDFAHGNEDAIEGWNLIWRFGGVTTTWMSLVGS